MQDIPMFVTENGAAGLALREIPYQGVAYITIHDTLEPEKLLAECVDFCKMAGAREIYATGHSILEKYPLHTAVWKMGRSLSNLPAVDAQTVPITMQTLEQWRSLYNSRMTNVPNSSTLTRKDGEEAVAKGSGYFIYYENELLGIGIADSGIVRAVASVKPGVGELVLLALCSVLTGEQVSLEVASTNLRAVRLYEKLGFKREAVLSYWYDVVTRKNT